MAITNPNETNKMMRNTEEIWNLVDAARADFIALSDRVWEIPELCYGEFKSCAEHTAMLKAKGFRVTENVAGIPTAVMGEAGEDGPRSRSRRRSGSTGPGAACARRWR